MFDLIVKGGRVVDGAGNPWYHADIGVRQGRIKAVGNLSSNAAKVIEAGSLTIAPGFIDAHSHSDLMLMVEPEAKQKIMQGVTTEVIGQDGLGEAPLRDDVIDEWRRYLSGLNGDPDIEWNWRSFHQYVDRLAEAKPAVNVASLVAHGNLRLLALGMENRPPTARELDEMKVMLGKTMLEGAFGLSTGLIYPPCVYAHTTELVELCKVTAEYDGVFVVHMRNEGDQLLESIREVASVGMEAGIPVHISHFKASGRQNWGKVEDALRALEMYRSEGIDMTFDQYPYTAGSTFLSSLLPVWVHEGGTMKMLERLRKEDARRRIAAEMSEKGRGRDWSWDNLLITSIRTEKNRMYEGETLGMIAKKQGKDPVNVFFDLIVEEDNAATMVNFSMSEDDIRTVMHSPFGMVCTDGIVLGKPHPRAYGSFPRVLGPYVREGVLRLEEAVRKMTSSPAQRFGLKDRGLLRPGMWADITIFDPEAIVDTATYGNPRQFPKGVEYLIVNGELTVDSGEYTGTRAGMVLRHLFGS